MNRDGYFGQAARLVFGDATVWWRVAVLALVQMVPILGSFVSTGYMMILMRDAAWGRQRGLPPFSEWEEIIRRGASGFVVSLVWGLVLAPIAFVALFIWFFSSFSAAMASGSAPQIPWWFGWIVSVPSAFLMVFVYVALLRSAVYLSIPAGLSLDGVRQLIRMDTEGFRQVALASLAVSLFAVVLSAPASILAQNTALPWYVLTAASIGLGVLAALVMMPLNLTIATAYGLWASGTNPSQWPPLRSR